jgi:hypothetical protein
MAKAILELMYMPLEGQEYVLSRFKDKYSAIEVNNTVYMIPDVVNDLIKELVKDKNLKNETISNK